MKQIFTYFLFLAYIVGYSQALTQVQLEQLEDEELLEYYDKLNYDSIQGEIVARVYLDRACAENDTIKMARGYDRLARLFHSEKNIAFADSIIYLTKNKAHVTYPGLAYLIKGYYYDDLGDLINSNKNFYEGYKHGVKNDNISTQLFSMNILVANKAHWGDGFKALELLNKQIKLINNGSIIAQIEKTSRERYDYSSENIRQELLLQSITCFISCYINLNDMIEARKYYNEGILILENYHGRQKNNFEIVFLGCLNEIKFHSKSYQEVVTISDSILSKNEVDFEISAHFDAYLFKGLSLIELEDTQLGHLELLKADSIFNENNLRILPYRRSLYSTLLKYYEKKKDVRAEIKYLNKLITWDSVLKKNYRYFESDMTKNFETPKLIANKERLILSLEKKNSRTSIGLYGFMGALSISIIFLGYYICRQYVYKRRYETLVNRTQEQFESGAILNSEMNNCRNEISSVIVEDILLHLEKFENKHKYLSLDVNLHDLAKSFGTNPNYLSRVINLKMKKNFSQYINDLRIVYIMTALKRVRKLRKYSIKAIANECGFKGADAFTRAFYKLNGIYPSFYLKQLNKEDK
jgi:AraC-like DNA-binding protein